MKFIMVLLLLTGSAAIADEYVVTPLAHYLLDKAGCSCKSIGHAQGHALCHIHSRQIQEVEGGFILVKCKKGEVKFHISHMAEAPH